MKSVLTNSTVEWLIDRGIIKKEEEALYRFGINQLVLFVINIATSIIIGIVYGMLLQSVLFSVMYIPLRRYAGGYHAKSIGRCYLLSILLVAFVLLILKYIFLTRIMMLIVLGVAFGILFLKSPVESSNKPLSKAEATVYKTKVRIILYAETILAVICIWYFMAIAMCIITAICCSAFMLMIKS